MFDFKKLKKSTNDIQKISEAIDKINNPPNSNDDRIWTCEVDKNGNGYAVIRFLPTPPQDGEDGLPWVRVFRHSFQGPTGLWYIENSLSTIGQQDPVAAVNQSLWNTGTEANKALARKQKRNTVFYSNIYIVEDDLHPENVGKVFLFRYGKKIYDKIVEATKPTFKDEQPINPFDLWNGANFKLKISTVEGYRNYDKSSFANPGPLLGDDSKLEEIWKSEYSLKEFLDLSNFKTYEQLEDRLNTVLGKNSKTPVAKTEVVEDVSESIVDSLPEEEETDSDLEFFRNLAKD